MTISSPDAAMGLGLPHALAALITSPALAINGVGTTQVGAAQIRARSVELVPASSNTTFIMRSGTANNEPYHLFNSQSTSAVVFPPVGDTLNGSANGSLTILQNKSAFIWQYKKGFWASILTA